MTTVEELEVRRNHIYTDIKRRQKDIIRIIQELSMARHAVDLLKLQYQKLDRKIFEQTVGITILPSADKSRVKKTKKKKIQQRDINKMSQAELKRTLAMLEAKIKEQGG